MKMSTSSLPCTKCHRMHRKPSIRSPTSYMKRVLSPDATSFNDDISGSSTPSGPCMRRVTALKTAEESTSEITCESSDNTSSDDDVAVLRIGDGNGKAVAMRRKRKGRMRPCSDPIVLETRTPSPSEPSLTSSYRAFRPSVSSRDSGIVSVVFDDIQIADPVNNNNNKLPDKKVSVHCYYGNNHHRSDGSELSSPDQSKLTNHLQLPGVVKKPTSLHLPPPNGRCSCLKKRFLNVLYEWVLHFPADFRNKKIMWTLNGIVKSCQTEHQVISYVF